MEFQELIQRGRFIMANAPARAKVFDCINGKRNAKDIAKATRRDVHNIRRDLTLFLDAGLIQHVLKDGKAASKDGFDLFEKIPLARTIPTRYFKSPIKIHKPGVPPKYKDNKKEKNYRPPQLGIPSEQEILDIANNLENQIYEFKGQGAEIQKITREIAAMLNTQQGGQIFYGIDDDGNIEGSDISSQNFDQSIQNSVRNTISPPPTVRIHQVSVFGSKIIVITVPPWDKKHVFMFGERVLLRKGTNVFAAKPEELRDLHAGKFII